MSMRTRTVFLLIVILLLFRPFFANGNELIRFANSILGTMIGSITEDRDGVIWIASFSKGITAYDKVTGQFKGYTHNPDNTNCLISNNISFSPQKLFVDRSNRLWVGTDDQMQGLQIRRQS